MSKKDIQRFWGYVEKSLGCWEWKGGINSTGRGIFWLNGKTPKAHRVSWIVNKGSIAPGQLVLHHCDNGKCVRPDHLSLGTYKDNTQDMLKKGRANAPKGRAHWAAKLSDVDVNAIRGMWLTGIRQKEIARRFRISQPTVSEIVHFKARI